MFCKDHMKFSKGRIGLQAMTVVERESHMEKIWMRRALNEKVQKKALCTMTQNKFAEN
jgi:hypothetical protein